MTVSACPCSSLRLCGARGAVPAGLPSSAEAAAGNGVADSQLLDPDLLALLQDVQAGFVSPEAAALQLRERSAGYEQARALKVLGLRNSPCFTGHGSASGTLLR